MSKKTVTYCYPTGSGNQVAIHCEDGSILFVNVGNLGADITYMPDQCHYPEPMERDDKGRERYPTEFTPFDPVYDSF